MPDPTRHIHLPQSLLVLFLKQCSSLGIRKYFRFDERAGIASLWHAFGPHVGAITNTIPGAAPASALAPQIPATRLASTMLPRFRSAALLTCPRGSRASALRRVSGLSSITLAMFPLSARPVAAAGAWLATSGRGAQQGPMQMIERYGPEFDPHTGNGGPRSGSLVAT